MNVLIILRRKLFNYTKIALKKGFFDAKFVYIIVIDFMRGKLSREALI